MARLVLVSPAPPGTTHRQFYRLTISVPQSRWGSNQCASQRGPLKTDRIAELRTPSLVILSMSSLVLITKIKG
jgi:hypothetical protein